MASIVALQQHIDDAAAGETTLELVAVRYTGDRTLFPVSDHLGPQAQWPGMAPLDGGPTPAADGAWNFALVPDAGLSHLEGRPDLDVLYAEQREAFAEALLVQDDLPENVFGRGANPDVQDRVFDALGIESRAEAGPFREQLRDIAGVTEAEDTADDEADQSLVADLAETYSRDELGDIAKELRSDPDEFNLRDNAKKTDRAGFIADADQEDRAAAIDAVTGGGSE